MSKLKKSIKKQDLRALLV